MEKYSNMSTYLYLHDTNIEYANAKMIITQSHKSFMSFFLLERHCVDGKLILNESKTILLQSLDGVR